MVQWPCIFKLDGDDELMFLASEERLIAEFSGLIWSSDDVLIDSEGHSFTVRIKKSQAVEYQKVAQSLLTEDVTSLIQAHEFSKAELCLTKIQFRSVREAIGSLASD